jgi:polyphosphate kinase
VIDEMTALDEGDEGTAPIIQSSTTRFLNRELSWLDFDSRVLALAEDAATPLLERAKFLAIFAENLDEFFQLRVAGLKDQLAAGLGVVSTDGLDPGAQLQAIRVRVEELVARQDRVFLHEVTPGLADVGITFSNWEDLDTDDCEYLVEVFEQQVFPVLTPLALDPGHPFPYISDLSVNLGLMVHDADTDERRFARVKVPDVLPRFVVMPDGQRWVPLEQVIAQHLGRLFPGMVVEAHPAFRVTRNGDLAWNEDEADDLLDAVELELRRRRFRRAVRLEVAADMDEETVAILVRALKLEPADVYRTAAPVDLGGLWNLWSLPRPDLHADPFTSVTQPRLGPAETETLDIFSEIRSGDILVHHPYDSFTTSVAEFVRQAADDPHVLAIKQTLYRTSPDSPIVASLVRAAESGKQVVALVELKARGDERANVRWARTLEEAGVHVVYGVVGLKTHSKTALVVRADEDGIRRYCHVGTGNYNERTARLYDDMGLLTCDPEIGADLTQLFNYITGFSKQVRYRKLLVAPERLRSQLVELIHAEAATGRGRIIMKMNSLADPQIIDELYLASQAGVEIDLVVRGICQLRPGVEGLSERIRVRSLVGRFLEHSRIYYFESARDGRPTYLIGSADLMERNLDRRVEALVPIRDPQIQRRLRTVLEVDLADDELAWALQGDGSWVKIPSVLGINAHDVLTEAARERRRGT